MAAKTFLWAHQEAEDWVVVWPWQYLHNQPLGWKKKKRTYVSHGDTKNNQKLEHVKSWVWQKAPSSAHNHTCHQKNRCMHKQNNKSIMSLHQFTHYLMQLLATFLMFLLNLHTPCCPSGVIISLTHPSRRKQICDTSWWQHLLTGIHVMVHIYVPL